MQMMPLPTLGGLQDGRLLRFGVFFPHVDPAGGFDVTVRVIHEDDQFLQAVAPREIALSHSVDARYGDYWSGSISLDATNGPGPSWGRPGKYIYRYCVTRNAQQADWIVDPFARAFGPGKASAILVDASQYQWSANEDAWRTPQLRDLVMYEINPAEFARSLSEAAGRLYYLKDLGINCVQLMPVTNVADVLDWGYLPNAYFGVDDRLGDQADLQLFVDTAHQLGIAVLIDMVYGHTSADFAYVDLYRRFALAPNPFMGSFGDTDMFGESTDFRLPLTRDYFYSVNQYWLDTFHIDGFRYDCVPDFYDGPFAGYGELCYATYQQVRTSAASGHWQRFAGPDGINLIQVAEKLQKPRLVLEQTYTSCTWQNETFDAATDVAHDVPGSLAKLGLSLGLQDFPEQLTVNGDTLQQSAVQYIENHDHPRFLTNFGTTNADSQQNPLLAVGDRDNWYRLQPYLIALLCSKGVPLLFQGEELVEDYTLPSDGIGRTNVLRPMRWQYFYSDPGRSMVKLVRRLLQLRQLRLQLRREGHYFYNDYDRYVSRGLLFFSRFTAAAWSLVGVNFTGTDAQVPFQFDRGGAYVEELQGGRFTVSPGGSQLLSVPSNYGAIWTLQ